MLELLKDKLSIYRRIALRTGKKRWLPDGFSLSPADSVPGETDGTLLYAMADLDIRPEVFEKLIRLLKKACTDPKKRKGGDLMLYFRENHILSVLDRLCTEIYRAERNLDLILLLDTAFTWATTSNDSNMVKFGISLMGMLNLDDREDCREVIVTLGKYEEFTLYSLFAVSGWTDAKKIISEYETNLKGWGKMHAAEWLEAENG